VQPKLHRVHHGAQQHFETMNMEEISSTFTGIATVYPTITSSGLSRMKSGRDNMILRKNLFLLHDILVMKSTPAAINNYIQNCTLLMDTGCSRHSVGCVP
jgi:hypothetical protein